MEKEPPQNDKELEKKAASDSTAREQLRQTTRATALYQAERIIELRNLDISALNELTDVGMFAFDTAFDIYLINNKTADENSNFSPYFGWWARQAIAKYLEEK